MFQLVLLAAAAIRTAHLADPKASDDALVAAGLAAIDAQDISQTAKDHARDPGTQRLLAAVIWCLRRESKSIREGWTGTGQPHADQFDQGCADKLDAVLAGFEVR